MKTTTPRLLATALLLAVTAACNDTTDHTVAPTPPPTDASTRAPTTTMTTPPSTTPQSSTPSNTASMPVPYDKIPIPDTPAGAQLTWFLQAVKHLPIATNDIEHHVAPAALQSLPPDQLNAALAAPGDLHTARYAGVLTATDSVIEAVIEHGSSQLSVLSISVDGAGLIGDLQFALMPLRPRLEAGLAPLQLPAPTGPAQVGTDTNITPGDGYAGRTVPVQVWYPAQPDGTEATAPYAPAANQVVLAAELAVPVEDIAHIETGATLSSPVDDALGRLPIVLFAPGLGVPRSHYGALASELASHGYLVAVLDHPGGANVVEYPDGTIVPGTPPTSAPDIPTELAIRVADAHAVVELLTQLEATPGSPFHEALDLEHIAFTGHSIGGASAAEAMRLDPVYDVGANLDGWMSGEVLETGLDRPFLLIGTPEKDESWETFESASSATVSVRIEGLAHMSFSDWPALSTLRPVGDVGADQIGTIDPTRAIEIQRAYLLAFLDVHLKGEESSLLNQQASSVYPEVTVG